MDTLVVPYTLTGQGDVERFFVPDVAHQWAQTIRPGKYEVPEEVLDALRPFARDTETFDLIMKGQHEATSGSYDNDVALLFCSALYCYESARAMSHDVVMNGWKLSADSYIGIIY